MLKSEQVDLSMLFPVHTVTEGPSTDPAPVFLSGEKKQAVHTSTLIPPVKTVGRVNKEVNQLVLQNYLYVTSHLSSAIKLISSRSSHFIELSQDLDDAAVFLLVENGLGKRFPTACDAWKAQLTTSKDTTWKSICEGKQGVDKKLKDDQPLLEDALAREIAKRIVDAYPYVLPFEFHLLKQQLTFP